MNRILNFCAYHHSKYSTQKSIKLLLTSNTQQQDENSISQKQKLLLHLQYQRTLDWEQLKHITEVICGGLILARKLKTL